MDKTLLIIDPGSTSTKIGVVTNNKLHKFAISHDTEQIASCKKITDQRTIRYDYIAKTLEENGFDSISYHGVIGRGGLLKPIEGGVYEVNPLMIEHLLQGYNGEHASNLGGLLAADFSERFGCRAFIADPVVVDELDDVARLSGLAAIERKSIFHALNQKAMALKVCHRMGKDYEDSRLIVIHMGGGITVGAHKYGRVVDVNDGLSGDGPFSPERSGGLPVYGVLELIKSGRCSYDVMKKKVSGEGGVFSYTGVKDIQMLEQRIESGDEKAELVLKAMVYQIAKETGAMAAVLDGHVDGIILTGGIAFSKRVTKMLKKKIEFISDIHILPGEYEIEALADAAGRALENPAILKSIADKTPDGDLLFTFFDDNHTSHL